MWSGDPVALDDAESASVFNSLCKQSTSVGLGCDNIGLCHGFVETIHLLSEDDVPVVTEAETAADDIGSVSACGDSNDTGSADSTITDSESDNSTLTDLLTNDSTRMKSRSDWFARVSDRHDGSPPEEHAPAIASRPTRICTHPVFYTLSPSGIALDAGSSGEFYAALHDSMLGNCTFRYRRTETPTGFYF